MKPYGLAPAGGELVARTAHGARRHALRKVRAFDQAGVGAVKHQRRRALGVGRGEQRRLRTALRDTEQRRALRAGGIHDGRDVIDHLLERVHLAGAVGEALATLVEGDQAAEPRQPLERIAHERVPDRLDV
jgi:hypothetical protein